MSIVRDGARVLRTEGPAAFARAFALRYLKMQPVPAAFVPGDLFDFTRQDLERNRAICDAFLRMPAWDVRNITWFLPVFSHPMAGVNNIFTLARLLREKHGIESRWALYGSPERSLDDARATLARFFPAAKKDAVYRILGPEDLASVPECDAVVSTRWDSCYLALKMDRTRAKLYLVQDYEPLMYPAGPEHALAEMSYRFGFARLCSTQSTFDATERFGGASMTFDQCVDRSWNRPATSKPASPIRIVFYGRPTNPRNAFGIGIDALRKVKTRFGDAVDIISVGEAWDPRAYGVEGLVENRGVLPLQELGELYRSAHIGLGMIFTRHPSLAPLEYWANGVAVVTNDNDANRWIFRHEENCLLAPPSASMMAEAIGRLVEDAALRARLVEAGYASVSKASWESEAEKVWRFMTRRA